MRRDSAAQLVELLRQLQAQKFQVQVVLAEPGLALDAVARSAARAGTKMVIVSDGDGAIENVARGLIGSRMMLGIIPTGTRNNLARSFNIPTNNIADAVALLRNCDETGNYCRGAASFDEAHYLARADCVGLDAWAGCVPRVVAAAVTRGPLVQFAANKFLIALLFGFKLLALSVLWSVGQRFDVLVFAALNLRGYHARWMDRAMWLTTQLGTFFLPRCLRSVGVYVWGERRFAIDLMLGTLTL